MLHNKQIWFELSIVCPTWICLCFLKSLPPLQVNGHILQWKLRSGWDVLMCDRRSAIESNRAVLQTMHFHESIIVGAFRFLDFLTIKVAPSSTWRFLLAVDRGLFCSVSSLPLQIASWGCVLWVWFSSISESVSLTGTADWILLELEDEIEKALLSKRHCF